MRQRIEQELKATMELLRLFIPSDQTHLMAKCRQQGFVQKEEWNEEQNGYDVSLYVPSYHSLDALVKPYLLQG